VIMPEHYHLVIDFHRAEDLHGWLHDVQSHTANELAKRLRNTLSAEQLAVYAKHANGPAKIAVWKEQARALGIISGSMLRTRIDYIHKNPVDANLVNDPSLWPWSSWRNYYLDDDSILRVDRVELL